MSVVYSIRQRTGRLPQEDGSQLVFVQLLDKKGEAVAEMRLDPDEAEVFAEAVLDSADKARRRAS